MDFSHYNTKVYYMNNKLLDSQTLHIDYPDISKSVTIDYAVKLDDIGRKQFVFEVNGDDDFHYKEFTTIGKDEHDYHVATTLNETLLMSAVKNTISFIVSEYA